MRKLQLVLCSAVFSAVTLTSVSVAYAQEEPVEQAEQGSAAAPVESQSAESAPAESQSAEPAPEIGEGASASSAPADPYKVTSFFADFTHYDIGDTAPALYRSKKYEVTQWTARHLPAPVADSHWTYMGGNYVLIANAGGKILKAESGDIYYKH